MLVVISNHPPRTETDMSFADFARPARRTSTDPIRGRRHGGFVIGWLTILALGVGGYVLAATMLTPSSAPLHVASVSEPILN